MDIANRCELRKIAAWSALGASGAGARMVTSDENFIEIYLRFSEKNRWAAEGGTNGRKRGWI